MLSGSFTVFSQTVLNATKWVVSHLMGFTLYRSIKKSALCWHQQYEQSDDSSGTPRIFLGGGGEQSNNIVLMVKLTTGREE